MLRFATLFCNICGKKVGKHSPQKTGSLEGGRRALQGFHVLTLYLRRQVDGLYRPGYMAAVGRSILKKFLLLALLLDHVQDGLRGSLPLPLLFRKEAHVKSSAGAVRGKSLSRKAF